MDNATEPQMNGGDSGAKADAGQVIDLTGRRLGDYQILRRIGQGGMGQVYLAEQVSLRRKVAFKVLKRELAADKITLQRFKDEALNAARATHANIVQIYAMVEFDGLHCIALEYVEGRNLREYIEKKGPPELLLALSIMRQVAAALQRASELGVIHRDIKPENILVTRKGEVKVADFGLSRALGDDGPALHLTQTGVTMGTPLYMSPEQVEGKPVDPRTDIYSFGVTCYHMLSGHPPFRGQTPFEVAVQHVQKEPVPLGQIRPDLPPDLCALVHKMMAKNPADRPQTGREIVRDLVRLRDAAVGVTGNLTGSGSGVQSTSGLSFPPVASEPSDTVVSEALTVPKYSRRLVWIAVGSIVVALAGGLFIGWLRSQALQSSLYGSPGDRPDISTQQHEADLKRRVEEKQDLQAAIELGLIYLKERPLDRAADFFRDVKTSNSDKLRTLGFFGGGIVLAFQDKPGSSNLHFLAALAGERAHEKLEQWLKKDAPERKKGELLKQLLMEWGPAAKQWTVREMMEKNPPLRDLLDQPPLREMIAEALHHNAANQQGKSLPPVLELLRKPWNPVQEPPPKVG
jgi:serine/threonine protein kinase